MAILLEVCVADPRSLRAAVAGGADRLELCSALELGGLTPLPGMMRLAAGCGVPAYALVRPRSGDFVYDEADVTAMLGDIDAIGSAGLAGVVLGASRPDGRLDDRVLRRLVEHATGLGLTLHRAVDLVPEIPPAIELAVALGFERVLSSGRAASAIRGLEGLAEMQDTAAGRISIMPGAGLKLSNLGTLLARLRPTEIHASCSAPGPAPQGGAVEFGFAAPERRVTDASVVAAFKDCLGRS